MDSIQKHSTLYSLPILFTLHSTLCVLQYSTLQTTTAARLAQEVEYKQLNMSTLNVQYCSAWPNPGTPPTFQGCNYLYRVNQMCITIFKLTLTLIGQILEHVLPFIFFTLPFLLYVYNRQIVKEIIRWLSCHWQQRQNIHTLKVMCQNFSLNLDPIGVQINSVCNPCFKEKVFWLKVLQLKFKCLIYCSCKLMLTFVQYELMNMI